MTDIVERLRGKLPMEYDGEGMIVDDDAVLDMFKDAADEIERLRALLRKAKDRLYDTGCWDEADEIVAALGEKE